MQCSGKGVGKGGGKFGVMGRGSISGVNGGLGGDMNEK